MIMSLLTDSKLMNDQYFPDGYNVLTGEETNGHTNDKYGEIHTGDAWKPSRDRYCTNPNDMPVALIVFADKSHTDLHGALSLTPIIFTLTLFNRQRLEIIQISGDLWGTSPILSMEKEHRIRLVPRIKYKMSIGVYPSFLVR